VANDEGTVTSESLRPRIARTDGPRVRYDGRMKQVWIPKIGDPGVLEVREAADPEAKKGEVRVRVHATGINFADILARMGLYPDRPPLPCVVGTETLTQMRRRESRHRRMARAQGFEGSLHGDV